MFGTVKIMTIKLHILLVVNLNNRGFCLLTECDLHTQANQHCWSPDCRQSEGPWLWLTTNPFYCCCLSACLILSHAECHAQRVVGNSLHYPVLPEPPTSPLHASSQAVGKHLYWSKRVVVSLRDPAVVSLVRPQLIWVLFIHNVNLELRHSSVILLQLHSKTENKNKNNYFCHIG